MHPKPRARGGRHSEDCSPAPSASVSIGSSVLSAAFLVVSCLLVAQILSDGQLWVVACPLLQTEPCLSHSEKNPFPSGVTLSHLES